MGSRLGSFHGYSNADASRAVTSGLRFARRLLACLALRKWEWGSQTKSHVGPTSRRIPVQPKDLIVNVSFSPAEHLEQSRDGQS